MVINSVTGQWKEASRQRELLLAYLQRESGVGTLLDTRRTRDYDADNLVDQYLNLKIDQVVTHLLQSCLKLLQPAVPALSLAQVLLIKVWGVQPTDCASRLTTT